MLTALRATRLLSIVLWVGGIAFFAFAVAPVAFSTLSSQHEAGRVVAGCLRSLDWIGMACGIIFFIVTAVLWLRGAVSGRFAPLLGMLLALLMLAGTATLHFGIVPAMEHDRDLAGGVIDAVSPSVPARAEFERLHALSERMEGVVLLLGLTIVVLLAREPHLTPAAGTRHAIHEDPRPAER